MTSKLIVSVGTGVIWVRPTGTRDAQRRPVYRFCIVDASVGLHYEASDVRLNPSFPPSCQEAMSELVGDMFLAAAALTRRRQAALEGRYEPRADEARFPAAVNRWTIDHASELTKIEMALQSEIGLGF